MAASIGATGTIVTSSLQARRSSATNPAGDVVAQSVMSEDPGDSARSADATATPSGSIRRGREVVIDDHYSIDLDSPRSNLAVTDNDSAPGIDLTVRLGNPALDLAHDASAFRADDDSDLSFCQASTAPLENIVSNNVAPGRSFCVSTGAGAWFWLKIVRIETDESPGTITLIIDRLTHR